MTRKKQDQLHIMSCALIYFALKNEHKVIEMQHCVFLHSNMKSTLLKDSDPLFQLE